MAISEKAPRLQDTEEVNGNQTESDVTLPSYPYFGRSVRVVGDWRSPDPNQNPHEKNKRGELGKTLFNFYFNRTSRDPLGRISNANAAADSRNFIGTVMRKAPRGAVNSNKTQVPDPKAMTRHIKRVAKFLGADIVGIAAVHPSFIYAGGRTPEDGSGMDGSAVIGEDSPEVVAEKYPFAISLSVAWDDKMVRAHRHHIGDATYHFTQQETAAVYRTLSSYIRELGYSVIQSGAQPMPAALAAGIGELGRNGMLISERYGARIHLVGTILTDLPLVADKPIDIGVSDFCRVCRKCATSCPTNSISMEGKAVVNGVEKYKINWETCYRLRPHVIDYWESCLTCIAVCPYTKPTTWWHALAVQSLKRTPIPLRTLVVWPLKWIDDIFWGKVPRQRVQFMSYDSGVLHLKKAATATSPSSNGGAGVGEPAVDGKGHYYPLKENTRRFDILKEKRRANKAAAPRA